MTLANMIEIIYKKTQRLMVMDLYKIHFKEVNIKNIVYSYFCCLIKVKRTETIYFTRYDCGKSIRMFSLYSHELIGKIRTQRNKDT